eukprot:gene1612-1783_t
MTEQQRSIWLLSMPACAEINRAMLDLSGISYSTGEQNKDISQSRQIRDMKDTKKLLLALSDKNPFSPSQGLKNIVTGVHAGCCVNVDSARIFGDEILQSMTGKSATEFLFKRSSQIVTLASKVSIKVNGEQIQVDPQPLF